MSYYVAIKPSLDARVDLRQSTGFLLAQPTGFTSAPEEDWHITLAFLGDVSADLVPAVMATMGDLVGLASVRPFTLELAGAGVFGDKVLWVGVDAEVEQLTALANSARLYLNANTDYPFYPHLTLGKSDGSVDLVPLVSKLASYRGPSWTAIRVYLMQSTDDGPEWSVDQAVASWPLA
jgi:2'-5' RNA ligase